MKTINQKVIEKELIQDFYAKCKNYKHNLKMIENNKLKYEEVINDMNGVKAVAIKDVILENAGDPEHTWNHYLLEKKDELLMERIALLYDIISVDKVLNNVCSQEIRDIIKECYIVRNKKHDQIAYEHHMTKPTMYNCMNKEVLKQLKN